MKKAKFLSFTTILLLFIMLFALSACAGGGSNDENTNNKTYTITAEESDFYTVNCSTVSATAGQTVEFTVDKEPFVNIESVSANDSECTLKDGKYSFTMPQKNVVLKVEMSIADTISTKDGMNWSKIPSQIAEVDAETAPSLYGETKQKINVSFGTRPIMASQDSNNNLINVEIVSTNQDVIPAEAISGAKRENFDSINVYTTHFEIDLTKIKQGTTTLIFKETESGRILTKNIAVKPFGEALNGEIKEITVTVDFTDLKNTDYAEKDGYRIWFNDSDDNYVIGSPYKKSQFIEFKWEDLSDCKKEFTFTYNHKADSDFTISVGYKYFVDRFNDYRYNNFSIGNSGNKSVKFVYSEKTFTVALSANDMSEEIK